MKTHVSNDIMSQVPALAEGHLAVLTDVDSIHIGDLPIWQNILHLWWSGHLSLMIMNIEKSEMSFLQEVVCERQLHLSTWYFTVIHDTFPQRRCHWGKIYNVLFLILWRTRKALSDSTVLKLINIDKNFYPLWYSIYQKIILTQSPRSKMRGEYVTTPIGLSTDME